MKELVLMQLRRLICGLLAALLIVVSLNATAAGGILRNSQGVAIDGYDPVAYFSDGRPRIGSPEFSTVWAGAEWRFASADHRDLFMKMPERYAPQFGGYCAFAASIDRIAEGDPLRWQVVDGRLYLNKNWLAEKFWQNDTFGNITAGNRHWPGLSSRLEATP